MSEERKCAYQFKHRNRPRERCGLDADAACKCELEWGVHGPHCFWHCPSINKTFQAEVVGGETRRRLEQAVASGEYLEGALLEGSWLVDAHLRGARLNDAHMEETWLEGADLRGAYLTATHLRWARLMSALLQRVNGFRVDLSGAWLWDANLEGANLWRAALSPDTSCAGTDWGVCGEEHAGYWRNAAEVYRAMGRYFGAGSDYQRCDEFYFREIRMYHRWLVLDRRPAVVADWSKGAREALAVTWRGWWGYLETQYRRHHARAVRRVLVRTARYACGAIGSQRNRRGFAWGLRVARRAARYLGPTATGAGMMLLACGLRVVRPKPPGGWLTRLIWAGHRLLWGYGIRPARTVGWMAAVIALFTVGFRLWWPVAGPSGEVLHSGWLLAFTVALDAFTSVGYAGYRPHTEGGQLAAGAAGLCGMILAAAFIVALGTKYVRRGS